MNILSLDPAKSTGYAIFRVIPNESASLIKFGCFEVDNSSTFQGDHMLSMRQNVDSLLLEFDIEFAHVETFFFSKKFCNGSDENLILRAAIYQLLREKKIEYTLHSPTVWKKFICGKARPSPADIKLYGKTKAPKMMIHHALKTRYNIELPTHTMISGRRLSFRYDISDAISIGIYGIVSTYVNTKVLPFVDKSSITVQLTSTVQLTPS